MDIEENDNQNSFMDIEVNDMQIASLLKLLMKSSKEDKHQPQEPQVQQEKFKELSDEQKIHELIHQFYNEIVV